VRDGQLVATSQRGTETYIVGDDYWKGADANRASGLDLWGQGTPPPQKLLTPDQITVGSILWRRDLVTGLVNHFGCVRDFNDVWHVDKADTRHLRFKRDTIEGFAAGKQVQIELARFGIDSWTIDERVRQLHSQQHMYDPLGRNCEHAARFFSTGVAKSTQVDNAVTAAIVGGFALLLLSSKK